MGKIVDVVIPARKSEATIADVVKPFANHPNIGRIIVVSNPPSVAIPLALNDITRHNLFIVYSSTVGKGQAIKTGLGYVTTPYVVFCDSDITGLTERHIDLLISDALMDKDSMLIGVPDIPENLPERRLWAFPWVSGERCIPTRLAGPLHLHGYLMETQLNQAAHHAKFPVHFEPLYGLRSPYIMTEERLGAMTRDAEWGRAHGIL